MYDFAWQLTREASRAEELTQEAFARAFAAFERFRPAGTGRAWLFTIVRNLHANTQRGEHRHPGAPLEEAEAIAVDENVTEATLREHSIEALDAAIARLPLKLREAVVLDLKGMSCRESAEVLGCPPGTVMSRLFHARQKLKAWLLEAEIGAPVEASSLKTRGGDQR